MTIAINSDDIFRPEFEALTSGTYRALVTAAYVANTVKGQRLGVRAVFQDDDGNELEDSILVALDWKPGSPFRKLLELSNCLPDRGERLNPDSLLDLTFLFTLKVNTKDGKDYPNLIDVALANDED